MQYQRYTQNWTEDGDYTEDGRLSTESQLYLFLAFLTVPIFSDERLPIEFSLNKKGRQCKV